MKRKSNFVFNLVLFTFVLLFVILALGYPRQARLVPLIIGVPTLFLLAFNILGESLMPGLLSHFETDIAKVASSKPAQPVRHLSRRSQENERIVKQGERPLQQREDWKSVLISITWMIVMLAAIFLFGFLIGLPLFMLAYLKAEGHTSWVVALAISVTTSLFFYLLFGFLWPGELYSGILFGAFVPPL
jgi:hypothetical protein